MKDGKRINSAANLERSPGADPATTMLLRGAYAPPVESYWDGLEGRIMARVRDAVPEPAISLWSSFSEWRTVGLIAATIALVVTGATLIHERGLQETTEHMAAGTAIFSADGLPEGVPVMISIKAKDSIPEFDAERYLDPFGR